jgi:hypothetical protein
MAISVIAVNPNPTIPPGTGAPGGLRILSGIVQCVFKGQPSGEVTRDTLTFTIGRVNFPGASLPPVASCIASVASFGHDGSGNDSLWAVDSAQVTQFLNIDRGSGTADLEVVAYLAVRGRDTFILRVNYTVFYFPALP